MPSQFCRGSTRFKKYINLETSKPVVAPKCTLSFETLENENKCKSSSLLKLSFSAQDHQAGFGQDLFVWLSQLIIILQ